MRILVLTHNIDQARKWLQQQNIPNAFILDEREVALQNSTKFRTGFYDPNYSTQMVEYIRVLEKTYKSSRPLILLMDMRHHTATSILAHDISILYYDGSLSHRLFYNPTYKVDQIVKDKNSQININR